ncbi:MAG: hypothetical protein KDD67_10520 [Ignavibacteriae bacterium]|nr:hypothetical protein [Ignavibacteriota bacterium]MCB9217808.1 hypothetical protein [Ignavibacteria bacterium]
MIPELRKQFNRDFNERTFASFLQRLDDRVRQKILFRVCETPLFVPRYVQKMCEDTAVELALTLHTPEYLAASDVALHPEITVAGQPDHASFIAVDFAMTYAEDGTIKPMLVEIQGFPSLMAYQLMLAELLQEHFALSPDLAYINGDHTRPQFLDLLHRTIVADHDREQVILMEYDPWNQKTSPDFTGIKELLGIEVVDIRHVVKEGKRLHYRNQSGNLIPISRIYNRAIVDELERENVQIPFNWNEELDVEWAGHPNWFFRISKFSSPYLEHPLVPRSWFLHQMEDYPDQLDRFVLKPLFSFAGAGVIVGPTREDIAAIPPEKRSGYLLQEKIDFAGVVDTPEGGTRAEMRVMLVWPTEDERPTPIMGLVRMGRGDKMGVDQNKGMKWIGASCNFFGT